MPLFNPPGANDEFDAYCSSSLSVGDFVYVTGSRASSEDLYPVGLANPVYSSKMPAVGMVIESLGFDTYHVKVHGFVDLPGTVPINKNYFVGLDGRATSSVPTAPSGSVLVQIVGMSSDQNQLFLELNGLITKRVF